MKGASFLNGHDIAQYCRMSGRQHDVPELRAVSASLVRDKHRLSA